MEAAAHVVAQPADGHRAQRRERDLGRARVAGERVRLEQKQQLGRPRKLRRAAEPAVPRVERLRERLDRRRRWRRGRRRARARAPARRSRSV